MKESLTRAEITAGVRSYMKAGRGPIAAVPEHIVSMIFSEIAQALRHGRRVEFRGFGTTFSISQRKARIGRNPKTGEAVKIPARQVVKFKPSPELLS